jgi:hypothetical protein
MEDIFDRDVDHHGLIGSDDNLLSLLAMERMLADIPPEGLGAPKKAAAPPVLLANQLVQNVATTDAGADSDGVALTQAQIEAVQAECFAEDVPVEAAMVQRPRPSSTMT